MDRLLTKHLDIWTAAQAPNTARGRGRGRKSNGTISPHGIKKLRKMILELAVRGKLVPQNPDDEPASVLLKKIDIEKARLIKEKKIKKQKELPEISEEEQSFVLPEGWEWVRLRDLSEIKGGKRLPKGHSFSPTETSYIYIQVTNMKEGTILKENLKFISEETSAVISQYTISKNDLYITIAGTIGDVGCVPEYFDGMNFTENAAKIIFKEVDKTWLQKKLTSEFIQQQFTEKTNQLAQPKLALHRVASSCLALPSLAEQHRIVAKVDELMALCDRLELLQSDSNATHQALLATLLTRLTTATGPADFSETWQRIQDHFHTLFTSEDSIDQLKQTILQLAVMGKLVPQNPADEPASILLEKIAAEKTRLLKEKKIKKQKKLPEITEEEKPFYLPVGWEWSGLSDLFVIVTDGDHQAPPKSDLGVPFLVIGNLNSGKIIFDDCKYVLDDYYHNLDWIRKPIKGDILYTVTGSYGIPIPVDTAKCFCVQRHVAILKSAIPTPTEYLTLVLSSKYAFNYATAIATGIAQKTVPLTGLRKMPIPIPPFAEQHRIIAKVDELMTLCDTLKARLGESQTTQINLANAMIKQAIHPEVEQ